MPRGSLASVGLPERVEVLAHEGKVVVVGRLVREALDRVEHRGLEAEVAGERVGHLAAGEALGEDGGDAVLGDQLLEPGQVGRRRLGVGGEAGDRLELQPVAGEVGDAPRG